MSRTLPCLFALLLFGAAAARLAALEVVGEAPAWLAAPCRADWPRVPLAKVLAAIARECGQAVLPSSEVAALASERQVYQVDGERGTLRATLELLEATQELHIVVEPLRLRVETAAERVAQRRRAVNLNLRDYGVFAEFPDHPTLQSNADAHATGEVGSYSLFAPHGASLAKPPEEGTSDEVEGLLRLISGIAADASPELSGHGNVHLLVTPEEETALRGLLDEVLAARLRRNSWRITFGTLPGETAFPSGIVPLADAGALAARLQGAERVLLQGFAGQLVSGGRYRQAAAVTGAEVVNYTLDPRVELGITGHRVQLRAQPGLGLLSLDLAVDWLEPQADGATELRSGPRTAQGEAPDKDRPLAPPVHGGAAFALAKPAQWTWRPRSTCWLPPGSALVLVAEHPAGRALVVVEPLP